MPTQIDEYEKKRFSAETRQGHMIEYDIYWRGEEPAARILLT